MKWINQHGDEFWSRVNVASETSSCKKGKVDRCLERRRRLGDDVAVQSTESTPIELKTHFHTLMLLCTTIVVDKIHAILG